MWPEKSKWEEGGRRGGQEGGAAGQGTQIQ